MNGIVVLASIMVLLMIGGATTANAISLTPSEKQTCKIAGRSGSDCVKAVQGMAATEAANNLVMSKIIPKTVNYVVQIITSDSTTWSGLVDITDVNGTGSKSYIIACTTTQAPAGYAANVKIVSSADNPPSLTLNLLYNGQIVNSTTVHEDFVDATIENSGCPSK